jgi:hypothetical protein
MVCQGLQCRDTGSTGPVGLTQLERYHRTYGSQSSEPSHHTTKLHVGRGGNDTERADRQKEIPFTLQPDRDLMVPRSARNLVYFEAVLAISDVSADASTQQWPIHSFSQAR